MKFTTPIKKIISASLLILVVVGIFGFFGVVLAQDRFGLDTATGVGLPQNDLKVSIVNVIRYILGFLGIAAVIIILYGGFLWMTSGGDPNKIDKAKKTLISAVIGLIIILSAFIIASFVINSLQVALCQGDNCVTASCPTPPCTPTCANPPCTPGTSNQFTYINKFKDNSLSWSRTIGSGFNGTVNMPASATLEVGAYAKNRSGTINGLELFTASLDSAFSAQSTFANVPTDQEVVSDVYASWNSLAYVIGDQYKAKISALFSGNRTIESREVKTIVRPTHCFNNISDQGETGIDCGGEPEVLGDDYCGACDGGTCQEDSDCASGVCLPDGVCAMTPIIDYISPATDPNEDTNFNVANTLDDDVGNGAPGNFITIWGRNFGDEPGEITFTNNNGDISIVSLDLPAVCASTDNWQTYQIVIQIPELGQGDYQINVYSTSGLGSNNRAFVINNIERPGICEVNPNRGVYDDTTNIFGNNFPLSGVQNVVWYFRPTNVVSTAANWTATQTTDTFPENKKGQSSIRVYNGAEYSNYFKVLISAGGLGDPCGYDSYSCATDTVSCQTGLSCEADSCTCQVSTAQVCQPNTIKACDNGGCLGNQTCAVDGSAWGTCVLNDPACVPGIGTNPATQSVYTWAFSTFFGGLWPEPEVVEDCSRSFSCNQGDRLPSPTPWSEGWTTAHPGVTNAKSCINTIISARFTTQMDPNTLNTTNIKVFECSGRNSGCTTPVSGTVNTKSDNSNKENDYFEFTPTAELTADKWYKVTLSKDIRSYVNVPIRPAAPELLTERGCNSATDAYCWNFQTRLSTDPHLRCPDGCVECSPDPNPGNTMRWYGATLDYSANLDSADNVCLTLRSDNNWTWSRDKTANLSLIDPAVSTATNIGTAWGETIYDTPNPYVSVFATRPAGQNDFCSTTIDFTNPIVIENSSCNNGTTQSPSPWILSEDACLNAVVSARFSRTMVDSTVKNKDNIILQRCDSKEDAENPDGDCEDDLITNSDNIYVFDYSHEISNNDLAAIISGGTGGNTQGPLPEGFVVNNSQLDANSWYRVIIMGGQTGVRGSIVETSVTRDTSGRDVITQTEQDDKPQGILLTPSLNPIFDYNSDTYADYIWVFKTSSQICDINSVNVSPAQKFMRFTGETQRYTALAQASNCNILNSCLFDWTWQSLIELRDTTNSGNSIASINNLKRQAGVCDGGNFGINMLVLSNVDPVQTATAVADGETNIVAQEPGGKWGSGHLQVGYGGLAVIKYSPQKTVHFENLNIGVGFNIEANKSSVILNTNANLYKCTQALAYYKFDGNEVDNSGNNREMVNRGISFSSGYFNQAANFRGQAGNYLQINDPALKPTGSFTISAWVKPTAGPSPLGRVIFSNFKWDNDDSKWRGVMLGDEWGGCEGASCLPLDQLDFKVYGSGGSASGQDIVWKAKSNFFSENLNKWTHVVGVYQAGTGGFAKLYINGVPVTNPDTTIPTAVAYDPNTPTRIGHRADNLTQGMWNGLIDEVRLYNRALSEAEIKSLYFSDNECPVFDWQDKTLTDVSESLAFIKDLKFRPSSNYLIGAEYRMVLKGGPNGLKAWNGNELSKLNYNSTGRSGGEECESGLYPWSEQSGVCSSTCLLTGNLCQTRFAECQNTASDSDSDYCDNTCHNVGNNNTASCGDRVVKENIEECDDGNSVSSDGCSSRCLLEGSSDRWGSICGNGRIENGEQCDDGNTNPISDGDTCSSNCLLGTHLSGSSANVPVCGNGFKEKGEDCDDGNTNSSDGCSASCLNEGSTTATTCNNGLVESGQADSFSWTYQAVDDPDVNINMNNCTNGIWQVEVKRGDIEADDIYICEKDPLSVALLETNIWGKIIAKLKLIITNFWGGNVLAEASDGCGAGYTIVPQNNNYFSDRLEYMSQNSRIFTYIKNSNWTQNKKYKINVYDGGFSNANSIPTASSEVTIRQVCVLADVKVEIWPRGEEKYTDNFFCVGDECGRNTASKYDNDISAGWNIDARVDGDNVPSLDYDFPYLKVDGAAVDDGNNNGNNHLYMAWAINSAGYLIKADSFNWGLAGLPKFDFSTSTFANTSYQGDIWLDLNSTIMTGVADGTEILTVGARVGSVSKSRDVNINVFLCNNPWPTPKNFPYRDAKDNCGTTPCPNTNFEVYYCRDAGAVGEAGDLPLLTTNTIVYSGTPFKKEFLLQRDDKSDAVGIRVVANDNHYSPLVWYRENFDPNRQGNPQSITVDGYDAILEGRTVYANAVNIEIPASDSAPIFYPNIYLISYSEGADSNTQNIYSQMARYMSFNVGNQSSGGLIYPLAMGTCEIKDSQGENYNCLDNSDCAAVNAGNCSSAKAKLTRDTRRLGDIQDINWLLADYYNQKRCSNDKATVCYNNAQCSGGGTCANFYPDLSAGTYIAGRSFSVWPSWQATLGNILGSALPVDPLNRSVGFRGCNSAGYNPITCWNETIKKIKCPTEAKAYAYFAHSNGANINIYAFKEYDEYGGNWYPDWGSVRFINANPFSLLVGSVCQPVSGDCGNMIPDLDGPDNDLSTLEDNEDCNNCPFDVTCNSGNSCRYIDSGTGEFWQCTPDSVDIDSDSDDNLNRNDNCPFIANSDQADSDGDNVGNVCDNCPTTPNRNQADQDGDLFGDACDTCPNDYNPPPAGGTEQNSNACVLTTCGDGVLSASEACDDGLSETPPSNAGNCNATCSAVTFCGDGYIQATKGEACDDGNSLSGDGCSRTCVSEINTPVASCGNAIIDPGETCDCGNGLGPLPASSNCGLVGTTFTTYNIQPNFNINLYFQPYWRLLPVVLPYCRGSEWTSANPCTPQLSNQLPYCGDGEYNTFPGTEQCEGKYVNGFFTSNNGSFGWGQGVDATNQWACSSTCNDTGGWCGDGSVNTVYGEQCDPNDNTSSNSQFKSLCEVSGTNKCQWKACPPAYFPGSNISFTALSGGAAVLSGGASAKFTANNQSVNLMFPQCASIENNQIDTSIKITTSDGVTPAGPPSTAVVFVTDLSMNMNPRTVAPYDLTGQRWVDYGWWSACNGAGPDGPFTDTCRDKGNGIGPVYYTECYINPPTEGSYCACTNVRDWNSCSAAPPADIIKTGLTGAIGQLFTDILSSLQVALVGFNSTVSPSNFSGSNNFTSIINGYQTGSGQDTSAGVQNAIDLLASQSADNKIIVLMSNGKTTSDPSAVIATAKAAGIEVYSAVYGSDPTNPAIDIVSMNSWSSNPTGSSCDSGYCYYSNNDLSQSYSTIVQKIVDNISYKVKFQVGTTDTTLKLPYNLGASAIYNNQLINVPFDICSASSKTLKITALDSGKNVIVSSSKIGNYCPAFNTAPLSYEPGVANSNVAGASASNSLLNFVQNIKNLFFNLLSQIIRM